MNKKIQELEQKVRDKREEWENAQTELQEAQRELLLPDLIKKYEGKYFKSENSYGGTDAKKWWFYRKVTEVVGINECRCIAFQKTSENEYIFKEDDFTYLSQLCEEITEEEFANEYVKYSSSLKVKFN